MDARKSAVLVLILFLMLPVSSGAAILGEWKFDGNGNDEQGVQNAQFSGMGNFNAAGGISGGYAYIPSGGDYVYITYQAIYDLPVTFTVEFWFRQHSNQGFLQNLVYKGTAGNYNFRIFRQLYDGTSNFGPVIAGYSSSGPSWNQVSNPNTLAHDQWHYVVYTKNAAGHAYYLDGSLIHSSSNAASALTQAEDIIIADSAVDTDIDELKIRNVALDAATIYNNYQALIPPTFEAGYPAAVNIGQTGFDLKIKINEAGTGYWVVLPDGAAAPTSAEVKAGTGSGGAPPILSGNSALAALAEKVAFIGGLMPGTGYDVYVVAQDNAAPPNLQANPIKIDVLTLYSVNLYLPPGSTAPEYRSIAVPLDVQNPGPTSFLGPQIGVYDPVNIRVGRWCPALPGYREYPLVPDFLPGHAYWFLVRNGMTLNFSGMASPLVLNPAGQESCSVPLGQGWNQVGNPFTFAIAVVEIMVRDDNTGNFEYLLMPTFNITQGVFWVYNAGIYSAAAKLPVGGGGWVKKLTPGGGEIFFRADAVPYPDPASKAFSDQELRSVAGDVERPPAPPGASAGPESSEGGGSGGGGGGGGCFIGASRSE